MITRQEAIAELTEKDMPFELETVEVHGNPLRVFKNAPDSLREVWLLAAQQGDTPYSIYEDKVITYGEAHRQVVSVAAWLTSQGVKKGDRVALGMRNYPEWAIAFWATQCIGAVMVSLNAWWIADELKYALSDSGATAVIVDGERQDRLSDELLAELGIGVALVARGTARSGLTSWEEGAGNASSELPNVEILPDDFATILYTSGTTGFPKGAAGTNRNYITNNWNGKFSLALAGKMAGVSAPTASVPAKTQTVALSTFPFFHIAGLCGLINNTTNGVCVVTQFKWDAGDALRIVEKYKVNVFGGVPTVVRSFLEHPDFSKFDLSSIASIGQGGAPVPPDSVATIEAEFAGKVSASNGYGLTETTAAVIGNSGTAYFAKKDSVGLPYVGTEIRIAAEDGTEVRQGDIGEVWVYGPNNVRGYWNKPEETKKAFTDGWFHTGDAGYIDADGFIYVVDRIKDMVLRGGENVYCVEVETVLFEHEAVRDCAVIGLPHDKLGEEVTAVLVAAEGFGSDHDAEIMNFLKTRLASFKVPSKVFWHHEELPRNATGKVLKKDLRDEYSSRK
jgi:acyl-CoA synthetase (AMP-forming)/AMP-acid ligase II